MILIPATPALLSGWVGPVVRVNGRDDSPVPTGTLGAVFGLVPDTRTVYRVVWDRGRESLIYHRPIQDLALDLALAEVRARVLQEIGRRLGVEGYAHPGVAFWRWFGDGGGWALGGARMSGHLDNPGASPRIASGGVHVWPVRTPLAVTDAWGQHWYPGVVHELDARDATVLVDGCPRADALAIGAIWRSLPPEAP